MFENEDLPFELKDLPGVFSSFRRKVEKNLKIRPLIPVPEKISSSWTPKNQLPTLRYFGLEEFEIDIRAVLDFRWRRCRNFMDERMDMGTGLLENIQGDSQRHGRFRLLFQALMAGLRLPVCCSGLLGD